MTPPKGIGGLPPRRPDQMTSQPGVAIQPGSSSGVVTARIVQVIGGPNSGVFVYSGTPGPGTLIASLVGATTADKYGNAVIPDGLAIYNGTQKAFLGQGGSTNVLEFVTGASFEGEVFALTNAVEGTGNAAFISGGILGPSNSAPGSDDNVQVSFNSANKGGTSSANMEFIYQDTSGVLTAFAEVSDTGFSIAQGSLQGTVAGSVNGITPGTFGLAGAGATAGAPPTGTATQASSFAAGSPALSYLTAFASTYNSTVGAVNAIVNGLVGWGV